MVGLLAKHWNFADQTCQVRDRLARMGLRSKEVRKPVRRAKRLSSAQVDELVADHLAGVPGPETARRFGINESTVYDHLRRRNVALPPYRRLREADARAAAAFYRSGASLREVAKRHGVGTETLRMRLIELGVEIRP